MHKEQLSINRPYSNTNVKANGENLYQNNNKTDMGVYERSIVQKVVIPQSENKRVAYGQRVLAGSQISIKSLGNFGREPTQRLPKN